MKKTEQPIIPTFPNGQTVCPLGQGTWKMGHPPHGGTCGEIQALQHGSELGMKGNAPGMYDNGEELVKLKLSATRCRGESGPVSKVLPSRTGYRGTRLPYERSLLEAFRQVYRPLPVALERTPSL